ncbi:SDR family oxidoreductase [Alkalicoccus daliensis]|uniref:Uncharacterized conserved protein YbjT, contains NAD(P)-binding and DUF2867 domains n=1 Tax=Alkalicoccus daliensis TaxID=745820 RepID=A0A1H0I7I8_9BACI|nr:SDR family oxidoreductase [Alkalicoccus daliensis]SDO27230.1 Uncharacterized conserved protein YbjT, contains NAD(P)-binding and DUF2867 domains [Alkalicoccus daliensis]
MKVLVVGANGKIGSHLVRMLSLSTKHEVRAMIRKEEQKANMRELGAEDIVIGDLEKDFSHAFHGMDAVVFTAGSGGHTGKEQTEVIDRNGAIQTVEEAEKAGLDRFIMISSMMADEAETASEDIQHYLKAKLAADEKLQQSSLKYTILRPGPLSNDAARGTITVKEKLDSYDGSIPREDVAAVASNCLTLENTYNKTFELIGGDVPIGEALKTI